jgi:hypothetical protein
LVELVPAALSAGDEERTADDRGTGQGVVAVARATSRVIGTTGPLFDRFWRFV